MKQRRHPLTYLALVRRVVLTLAAAGIFYLVWRFDVVSLPAGAESGLVAIPPGSRLWIDARPVVFAPGDLVLFRADDGARRLGRIATLRVDAASNGGDGNAGLRAVLVEDDRGSSTQVAAPALTGRILFVWGG